MTRTIAARIHTAALRAEGGQGTVEYVGLAMAIGVLLLAVGSVLGKDHGIGSIITGAIKSALEQASGGASKRPVNFRDGGRRSWYPRPAGRRVPPTFRRPSCEPRRLVSSHPAYAGQDRRPVLSFEAGRDRLALAMRSGLS